MVGRVVPPGKCCECMFNCGFCYLVVLKVTNKGCKWWKLQTHCWHLILDEYGLPKCSSGRVITEFAIKHRKWDCCKCGKIWEKWGNYT